jgi:hypothetical protein
MLPKFSMPLRRRTITPLSAMRRAPLDRLMSMTAGRSCGVSPTASASENSSELIGGRLKVTLSA